MESLSTSSSTLTITISKTFPFKLHKSQHQTCSLNPQKNKNHFNLSLSSHFSSLISLSTKTTVTSTSTSTSTPFTTSTKTDNNNNNNNNNHHWMVLLDSPTQGLNSKSEIIDYYVRTLESVLGSEKDAQMCIYDASFDTLFGFCCDINEETSCLLASLPGVLSVRPDPDPNSEKKDYKITNIQMSNLSDLQIERMPLFPAGNSKHWLVRIDKPSVGVVTKAQMVDYYAQILTKVLGNEKDAQMCIYHVSWQSNFGFCCELDGECARELAGVPGVLSVQPDENFESENKDYGGNAVSPDSSEASRSTPIKTKKLFVTGLSFYTSEKTLRAAFEGFGELVEVRIIMDKISKRSRGYAFIEYTTEEAASAALKEMNGKIINGWMIVVDVAKTNPSKFRRGRPR